MLAPNKKQATLYRMVTDQHVCPYGLKSRDLLKREGFVVDDHLLRSRAEADQFMADHGVKTTPQTFIQGTRVGGYEALLRHFDRSVPDKKATTYQPVVVVFGMAALMSMAASWSAFGVLVTMRTAEWFIAFSMCILAIQKLRDLESFSNTFLGYDLVAQRVVRYAYFYPFGEAFAGVLMIAQVLTPLAAAVALLIGTVGAISVFKAIYIDKRELKCACVGGDSKVPLGFVSLTENLMMVAIAVWMLARASG